MLSPLTETTSLGGGGAWPPRGIASALSPALPRPTPTRPFLSPTTTSALKLKRRPPFTTLAERLMNTTFSTSSSDEPPKELSPSPGGLRRPRGPPRDPRCPSPPVLLISATVFIQVKILIQLRARLPPAP